MTRWRGLGRLIRRRLIAGLIVIAPLGVTVYILWWLFTTLDGILGRSVYNLLGVAVPGLGLILLVGLLLAVGWAAEATVGSKVVDWWHAALNRVPVVSRLYGATRRIVGSVFGTEERKFFRSVVLFEYPSPGQWTMGFETGEAPRALDDRVEDGVTIFLPTAPNPVTGFLIIVPAARIVRLPVTVEEGFTFVFSAGAVPPTGPGGREPPPPSEAEGPVSPHQVRDPGPEGPETHWPEPTDGPGPDGDPDGEPGP
jgi:uncharacterized membrane protein